MLADLLFLHELVFQMCKETTCLSRQQTVIACAHQPVNFIERPGSNPYLQAATFSFACFLYSFGFFYFMLSFQRFQLTVFQVHFLFHLIANLKKFPDNRFGNPRSTAHLAIRPSEHAIWKQTKQLSKGGADQSIEFLVAWGSVLTFMLSQSSSKSTFRV